MFDNILMVSSYVLILFILIGVGFITNKLKVLSKTTVRDMTNFVLYFVTPCVLINSYQREFDKTMLAGLGITLIAAFASFAINILIAHLVIHDKDKIREKTLIFGSVFPNCGYMSLPLQGALLGQEGIFYGATYIAVFQIMVWTYGVFEMSRDAKMISFKKILVNPGVLGTLIGLVLFLFSIKLPFVIKEPISYLAALNTPVPMVIVGYHLADASLKIKGKNSYISLILRLVVSPALMLLGFKVFGITGAVAVACLISASAPTAANTTMFSEKFGGDIQHSATMVSMATLLSIITIPIFVGIATTLS